MPDGLLNSVLQYGSFGVLVAAIIYFGRTLIPQAIQAFKDQGNSFQQLLKEQEARHDVRLNRREEICDKLADNVGKIAEQVNRLTDKIDTINKKG